MTTIAPYGAWPSPIDSDTLVRAGARLAYPTLLAGDMGDASDKSSQLAWLEGRPSEAGRQVVVRARLGQAAHDVTPAKSNARSLVHEYGGQPFVFVDGNVYFVELRTQTLHGPDGLPLAKSDTMAPRIAEPIFDRAHDRFIAVGELHRDGREAENGLVSIDRKTGAVTWVVRGRDFYAAPTLSPDGAALAFLAWSHPHMPWDAAEVLVSAVAADGTVAAPEWVAGGSTGSAFQPLWSPRGELYFALEGASGAWNIHRRRNDAVEAVHESAAEWGAPLWNLGTRLFGFAGDGSLVGAPMKNGVSQLVRLDVHSGTETILSTELPSIGQLDVRGDDVLVTVGWAGGGSRVVHFDLASRRVTTVADPFAPLFADGTLAVDDVPTPEWITFAIAGGDQAHALYYPPTSARFRGADGTVPPLMVLAHGGPTGAVNGALQLPIVQWTSRGFAVLDVAYRGSTGFGRAYREKLRGQWGAVDVEDCVHGALALAESGRADRARLAIRGGSAGGYTVLMALCLHPTVFAAATCLYGISDPRLLQQETHKFESRYDDFLFGAGEARAAAFAARTPLTAVEKIRTPVLFFQGLEDKAVPPAQTRAMHEALEKNGVASQFFGFAGEQHGFRKAETLRTVFDEERRFYESRFT